MAMLGVVCSFLVLLGYGQREIIEPLWKIQHAVEEEAKKFVLAASQTSLVGGSTLLPAVVFPRAAQRPRSPFAPVV